MVLNLWVDDFFGGGSPDDSELDNVRTFKTFLLPNFVNEKVINKLYYKNCSNIRQIVK